jgi:hypothetical protein
MAGRGEVTALAGKGQKMAAVFALHAGKTIVEIAHVSSTGQDASRYQ